MNEDGEDDDDADDDNDDDDDIIDDEDIRMKTLMRMRGKRW